MAARKRKNFIQRAINPRSKGALRRTLHAKAGEPIPASKLAKAAHAPGKLGQRARFAEMLRGLHRRGSKRSQRAAA